MTHFRVGLNFSFVVRGSPRSVLGGVRSDHGRIKCSCPQASGRSDVFQTYQKCWSAVVRLSHSCSKTTSQLPELSSFLSHCTWVEGQTERLKVPWKHETSCGRKIQWTREEEFWQVIAADLWKAQRYYEPFKSNTGRQRWILPREKWRRAVVFSILHVQCEPRGLTIGTYSEHIDQELLLCIADDWLVQYELELNNISKLIQCLPRLRLYKQHICVKLVCIHAFQSTSHHSSLLPLLQIDSSSDLTDWGKWSLSLLIATRLRWGLHSRLTRHALVLNGERANCRLEGSKYMWARRERRPNRNRIDLCVHTDWHISPMGGWLGHRH